MDHFRNCLNGLNEKGEDYKNLDQVYDEVYSTFGRYIGHAATHIGGVYTDLKTTEQEGAVYTVVPKATQKEALAFIQKNLFATPTWLLNKAIMEKVTSPVEEKISSLQDGWLNSLLKHHAFATPDHFYQPRCECLPHR